MLHSIQEYLKIINSRLDKWSYISLLATTILLTVFAFYLNYQEKAENMEVYYITDSTKTETYSKTTNQTIQTDPRPFASKNGKTYTFSWCGGAERIKTANKVYFNNEEQARATGRSLSKLCSK